MDQHRVSWPPSTPLRERKKRDARSRILATAIALFREIGSAAVPVAVIARECDLSEATFFNYFPSKDALLSEWLHDEVGGHLARAVDEAATLRRGLRAGVESLVETLELDREIFVLACGRARLEVDRRAPGATGGEVGTLEEAVRTGQRRGELRSDIEAAELAAALQEVVVHGLARALDDDVSPDGLRRRTLARLDLLVDGARKRNERVRAPAGA